MARPRHQPAKSAKTDNLKTLSSEVLLLRLQQLNLPITGSRTDLIDRLCLALHPPKDGEKSRVKGRKTSGRVVKKTAKRSTRVKKQAPKRPACETDGSKTPADDAQESDGEQEPMLLHQWPIYWATSPRTRMMTTKCSPPLSLLSCRTPSPQQCRKPCWHSASGCPVEKAGQNVQCTFIQRGDSCGLEPSVAQVSQRENTRW